MKSYIKEWGRDILIALLLVGGLLAGMAIASEILRLINGEGVVVW